MKILKNPETLVVDANPILSALIKGAASRIFWSQKIGTFATTEFTIEEVNIYIPELAHKARVGADILVFDLSLLPLEVHPREFYEEHMKEAEQRIGKRDPKDIDILALALRLKAPVWTNDKDFEETGIEYYPTAKLLKILTI